MGRKVEFRCVKAFVLDDSKQRTDNLVYSVYDWQKQPGDDGFKIGHFVRHVKASPFVLDKQLRKLGFERVGPQTDFANPSFDVRKVLAEQ